MILGDGTEVRMGNTYGQGEVGDKRGSKEMDQCPLTLPPLQKCSVTMCKARQEVARSALVNGIESKRATLI
jgi:hypothetical protein